MPTREVADLTSLERVLLSLVAVFETMLSSLTWPYTNCRQVMGLEIWLVGHIGLIV